GTAKLTGAGFRNAPVYILVLGDPRVNEAFPIRTREDKGQSHFITGLASATLLIHLAATSLGLASQWVSDAGSPYMSTMLRAWLGIPEALRVYDMVPIGYPVRVPPATPRRPLAELIHRDRYDQGRYRNEEQIKAFIGTATLQGSFGRSSKEAAESGIETR
ncbi:MAG: nitroreductase family protein, partial [Dehalococcoidia bacterium]|nr:nitroreductase family protein [Dehalococcoidia bacterium]